MFDTLGDSAQIFSSSLYAMYWAPDGFGFDTLDDSDPFINDERLTTYNAPEKAQAFHEWIINQKQYYRSNNIIIPMGADFNFQNARQNFDSTQALIHYYNENFGKIYNVELINSTPSMYIDAVFADDLTWSTKYDDMFPYANNDVSYWTGYFSSRANDKEYIRRAEHILHASNKVFAFNSLNQEIVNSSDFAQKAVETKDKMMDVVGVTQHHDAVTGTGKQHVSNDYARQIYNGIEDTNPVYASALNVWLEKSGFHVADWKWCLRTNSTYVDCPIDNYAEDESLHMLIAMHNPANLPTKIAEIAVPHGKLAVQRFDAELGLMVDTPADVLCQYEEEELYPSKLIDNCQLFIKHEV